MPVQFHHLAQVGHHLVAPAVVGNFQQTHVKRFIERKKAFPVADFFFKFIVQALQFLDLGRRCFFSHHACRITFKQGEQVIDIGQVGVRHLGDISAAPHFHGHQAFSGQYLQRFA